jgi:RNA polymerase sigma factor (sigma-70 family)
MSATSGTNNSARKLADEAVDQLWLDGDPDALAKAHTRYRTRLEAVAFRILRNHADAEDVVQRIFIAARKGSYRGSASLWTYLYRAAVNGSVNVLRSKGRREKLERKVYENHLVTHARTSEASPESRVFQAEMMAAVAKALLSVKPQHRRVLTLRVIHGLTNTEIAEREELPLATVGTWLRRGRVELQRSLRPLLKEMGRTI